MWTSTPWWCFRRTGRGGGRRLRASVPRRPSMATITGSTGLVGGRLFRRRRPVAPARRVGRPLRAWFVVSAGGSVSPRRRGATDRQPRAGAHTAWPVSLTSARDTYATAASEIVSRAASRNEPPLPFHASSTGRCNGVGHDPMGTRPDHWVSTKWRANINAIPTSTPRTNHRALGFFRLSIYPRLTPLSGIQPFRWTPFLRHETPRFFTMVTIPA